MTTKDKNRVKGEGSIYQRPNGYWIADITIDGKTKSFGAKSKSLANKKLKAHLLKLEQGIDANNKMTVSDYAQQYLATKKDIKKIADKSLDGYEREIRLRINPTFADTKLRDLTTPMANEWARKLVKTETSYSVLKAIKIARSIFAKAIQDDLIIKNPFDSISEDYTHKSKAMNPLEDYELEMFLISAEQDPFYAYWYLLAHTGIRRGEGLALTWNDIDLTNKTISINKTLNEKMVLSSPKTEESDRVLNISDDLVEVLENQRIKTLEMSLNEHYEDNNLAFPNVIGRYMSATNLIKRNFAFILKRAGLKDRTIHDLRHTFASLYIHETKDIAGCSKFLGHSKKSITLDYYTKYLPKVGESPATVISEIVKKAKK